MTAIPEPLLAWAVEQLASPGRPRPRVVEVVGMRAEQSPWLLRLADGGGGVVLRVGDPQDVEQREGFRVEVAMLGVARAHGLPTATLLGCDLTGDQCGSLAVLSTLVAGSSRIPAVPTAELLREYGAATALLHRVPGAALGELPRRVRPISGVDFAAVRRERGASRLLVYADELVARRPVPDREPVLVHGDLWLGNTMWEGSRLTAFLDWDCAGVGEAGLDVGSARLDAALMFGLEHADAVLAGYLGASGRDDVADMAYWDVVAALSTPPRMAEFVPVIQAQGRPDLDQPVLERRRDDFLRAALGALERVS